MSLVEVSQRRSSPAAAARAFTLTALITCGAAIATVSPQVRLSLPAVLASATLTLWRRRWHWLAVCFVALGWFLGSSKIARTETATVARLARTESAVGITGVVVAAPQRFEADTTLTVRTTELTLDERVFDVHERVSIVVRAPPWASRDDVPSFEIGDAVSLDGVRLRPMIAGGFARRIAGWRAGIAAKVFADPDEITVTGVGGGLLVRIARWGRGAVRAAASRLDGQPRALLLGITIGDTSELDPQVSEDFRRTGLTHLVAVSGANLAIVLAGLFLVLRLVRAPVAAIPWTLAAFALAFCSIAAFEPSVVRAGAMAILGLIAFTTGAARRSLDLLGLGCAAASLIDPFLAFTLGFQLSVLATFGLITIARRLQGLAADRPVLVAGAASLGAQLATMPLLAAATGRLSIISLPANLIVGPLVAPATILGFVATLGVIVPPLRYVAHLAHPVAWLMLLLARLLADIPGAVVDLPGGPAGLLVVGAMLILGIVTLRGRYRRAGVIVAVAILIPVAAGVWSAATRPQRLEGLRITMIDVGQGEAILISEGGRTMLIDGGVDADDVPRYLRDHGILRLDYLVVSHPHDDHVSGLVGVAERATIGAVLDPGLPSDLGDYQELLEVTRQRGIERITARAGQTYRLGDARIRILWPVEPLLSGTDSDLNENSIVFRIDFGRDAFLYAGETQQEAQLALVERGAPLRAEVLKVSHHGSGRMFPDFYRATGAQVAMIPVGPNSYGHPAPETLSALAGMQILRSDEDGDVEVTLDGADRLAVRTER